jgi:sec-independent protein translocase protein TatA
MAGLSGWHLVILLVVVVLLFAAKRLPDMARAVGQSVRIFKGEMNATAVEEHPQFRDLHREPHRASNNPRTPPAVSPRPQSSDPTSQRISDSHGQPAVNSPQWNAEFELVALSHRLTRTGSSAHLKAPQHASDSGAVTEVAADEDTVA